MYIDKFGKKRQKIGLHIHTSLSDGRKTPEEVVAIYKAAGYDAIALTDHWYYGESGEMDGMKIISGAEYNVGSNDTVKGTYHILGLFMEGKPDVTKETPPQRIIDVLHELGGLAVLTHPAWSLNTPEKIMALEGIDATEIYNTVSAVEQSFRADSSLIIDMIAGLGRDYPLLATDDSHYYKGEDNCVSYIMVESESTDDKELKKAILEKKFYATQGPEIHLTRVGDKFRVDCSPVQKICFASNTAWCPRIFRGEGITSAEYTPVAADRFVRAFVIDSEGRTAWSNIEML